MTWILIVVALLIALFVYFLRRKLSHPAFIFEVEWAIILFLYQIRLFGFDYYEITMEAFWLMMIQLIAFPIGFFTFEGIRLKKRTSSLETERTKLFEPAFIVLCLISAGVLLVNDIVVIRYLAQGYSFIDLAKLGISTNEKQGFYTYLLIFVVYPTVSVSSPICAIEFVTNSPKRKWLLLLNIILVALSSLDHGGRVYLVNMVTCYIFAFIVYGKKISLSKKQRRFLIALSFISASLIVVLSFSRGIEDFWKSIYLYSSCSFPHMISRMEQPLFSEHTFGFLSLRGFFVPVVIVLQFLGILSANTPIYSLVEQISVSIEQDALIGTNVYTNAFLPSVYYFYIDFGFLGAILGMIIYGAVMGSSYRKAISAQSKKHVAIFLFLMYGLISSYIRFPFKAYQYALGFLLILILYRKANNNATDSVGE